jgi:hypothetical protein
MTPDGHLVSLLSPHDHKHHKGLMYALMASDVSFWEEQVAAPGQVVGRQRHDGLEEVIDTGESVGFDEALQWLALDDTLPTFIERRSIRCAVLPERRAYVWTWSTELTAQRDVELTMSQWSKENSKGVLVNYHGLGLRFRRDFGCTGGNRLVLDGLESSFEDGLGKIPREAVFEGSLDSIWPLRRAGVSFGQSQQNALFVMDKPFAFLSLGPTNLAGMMLREGQRLSERYVVTVFDVELTNG